MASGVIPELKKIEPTPVYLRGLNRLQAMERVRDLTWDGPLFEGLPVEAPSGLEPEYAALQAAA